jgi:hypothetical protein
MKQDFGSLEILGLVAGFAIWSLVFVVLYGAHGLACGRDGEVAIPAGLTRAALILLYFAGLGAQAALVFWFRARLRTAGGAPLRFLRRASFLLAAGALVATAWTGLPVLTTSICT